jgi:hypothetical protein
MPGCPKLSTLFFFYICFYAFFISVIPVIVYSYLFKDGTKNSLNSFEKFVILKDKFGKMW